LLGNFKELAIGLEIFNLFNNQNAITNTWVWCVFLKANMQFKLYDDACFNVECADYRVGWILG
jgi:hypothetical protein